MAVNLPPNLSASIQDFVEFHGYKSQNKVLRDALAALKYEIEMAATLAAIDDEQAGRIRPWAEVKDELRAKLGLEPRE